jgi:phage tail tape-measure protein
VVQGSPFTLADISAGVAGASIERTSKFRKQARQYARRAAQWDRLAKNRSLSPRGQARAIMRRSHYRVQSGSSLGDTTGRLSRFSDGLSPRAKQILTAKITKGIPVVGTGITVLQAGVEIYAADTTEEKVTAGFSAGASLLAGAAAGAAVGGPVGAVVGAGVAVEVGYAVNEWGDNAVEIAQGAADAVGDFVDDIDLNPF